MVKNAQKERLTGLLNFNFLFVLKSLKTFLNRIFVNKKPYNDYLNQITVADNAIDYYLCRVLRIFC